MRRREDLSGQAIATGVAAGLLGYASSIAVVITGLQHAGASRSQITSGLVALGLFMAILGVALSARYRLPVSVVWSTPAVALLASQSRPHGGFPVVVGSLLLAAALIVVTGLVRPLTRLVSLLPAPLTSAVLAGVLLPFCLQPARGVHDLPLSAGAIAVVWLVLQRFAPRWSAPGALVALVVVVVARGDLPSLHLAAPTLHAVAPHLTATAVVQIALPVYLVTMAGQNLVGLAVLKAEGYDPPVGALLVGTGAAAAAGAAFGAPTANLAAITGALTAGPQAHPDPRRRWVATATCGLTHLVLAALAPVISAFVTGIDSRLVGTAAGLALVLALASAASNALRDEAMRIPAVLTLLVTASGITAAPAIGLAVGLIAAGLDRSRGTPSVSLPAAERP